MFLVNDPVEKIVEEIIALNFNSPLPSSGKRTYEEATSLQDFFGGNIVGPSAGYDSDESEASRAREKKRLKKIKSEAKLKKK